MNIEQIIDAQKNCLRSQLNSYTFKSSAGHWYWRETEPVNGQHFVDAFNPETNSLVKIPVRYLHIALREIEAGYVGPLSLAQDLTSTCPYALCVHPDHAAQVFMLTDSKHKQDPDDWSLPLGWEA